MLSASTQVRIRDGKAADAAALGAIFRESWTQAYRGIIPHLHLETMIRRRGAADWWVGALRSGESILILEVEGKVAGYATTGAARARGNYEGEIYELYLAPLYQGAGLGELLFEGCRHKLDLRKLRGLVVWALSGNTPAIDFYWRRGGRPIARSFDRIGGSKLEKIAFAWT